MTECRRGAPEKGSRWRSQQRSRTSGEQAGRTEGVAAARQKLLQRRAHRDAEGHDPSRKEVQGTTTVVIITVFLFGVYFWAVDAIIGKTLDHFLKSLAHR